MLKLFHGQIKIYGSVLNVDTTFVLFNKFTGEIWALVFLLPVHFAFSTWFTALNIYPICPDSENDFEAIDLITIEFCQFD